MRFGRSATSKLTFNTSTLPTLETDFNTVPDDGLLRSSRVLDSYFVGQLGKGSWVRVVDEDDNTCLAQIKKIQGPLFYLAPDWSTWTAEELTVSPAPVSIASTPLLETATSVGTLVLRTVGRNELAAS